jgi:hypothetical protein
VKEYSCPQSIFAVLDFSIATRTKFGSAADSNSCPPDQELNALSKELASQLTREETKLLHCLLAVKFVTRLTWLS